MEEEVDREKDSSEKGYVYSEREREREYVREREIERKREGYAKWIRELVARLVVAEDVASVRPGETTEKRSVDIGSCGHS